MTCSCGFSVASGLFVSPGGLATLRSWVDLAVEQDDGGRQVLWQRRREGERSNGWSCGEGMVTCRSRDGGLVMWLFLSQWVSSDAGEELFEMPADFDQILGSILTRVCM